MAVALVGYDKADETVPIGSKKNFDKGMAVIDQYHEYLQQSDRKLFEAEEKSRKLSVEEAIAANRMRIHREMCGE